MGLKPLLNYKSSFIPSLSTEPHILFYFWVTLVFYVLRIPLNAALTPLIQVSRRQVRVGSGPPALQAGSFSALISGPEPVGRSGHLLPVPGPPANPLTCKNLGFCICILMHLLLIIQLCSSKLSLTLSPCLHHPGKKRAKPERVAWISLIPVIVQEFLDW